MKALVLGGNGFIGTHLVDALISANIKVRVYDRPGSQRYPANPRVDYRSADMHDLASLAEALAEVDIVFHLVSSNVPSTSVLDPVSDVQNNLVGSLRLLQQMKQTGVTRIVFVSSGGAVYGNPDQLPVSEGHPLRPISSYGVVKVAIESYLGMYAELYGFSTTIIRPSNPYGPKQTRVGVQGVIPTFFGKLMTGEPVSVWGTGDVVRDYIYIDDLVSAIVELTKAGCEGVFNVGSGVGTSLMEVIETISTVSGLKPEIEFKPSRSFDVKTVVLDIDKTQSQIEWSPQVPLKAGCESYWRWLISSSATLN